MVYFVFIVKSGYLVLFNKGQLISKAIFQAVDSPKKRTDEFPFFDLKSCYVVKSNAVRSFFLEKLRLGNLLSKLPDL